MGRRLLITIILTQVLFSAIAQFPVDPETKRVKYTDVVDFDGLNKEQLYNKAKFWIVSTLKSDDNMIDLNDENFDKLIGAGTLLLDSVEKDNGYFTDGQLSFKFILFFKEGKLKYSIENFLFSYYDSQDNLIKVALEDYNALLQDEKSGKKKSTEELNFLYLESQIKTLIADFRRTMNKQDKDW